MSKALVRLEVEGFRSLRRVALSPGRQTLLIGPNGSGKSSVLAVLRLLPLIRTHSLRRFVAEAGGASALLHYGPRVTREIVLRLEFEQETGFNAYGARLGYAAGDSLIFLDETVEYRPPGSTETKAVSLGAGHNESRLEDETKDRTHGIARVVDWWLSRMNFFHVHDTSPTSPLRQNSRVEDTRFLRSDGSNLAAYLKRLADGETTSDRAAWTRIGALVRRVAPFIKSLQPSLVGPAASPSAIRLDWIDERDEVFGPHHLSDGTLRAIALIVALASPTESLPAFVSIDEPELGLHPAALSVLAGLVRSVSDRCQVLLATQSPALLDLFEPEDVVVVERCAGETQFRRLDRAQLDGWLQTYTLSQLYDKNVLGGRP